MNKPALAELEQQLATATLQHARLEAGRRVGRVFTDGDVEAAAARVERLTAAVTASRAELRQGLAGEGNRLLSEIDAALEATAGVQAVLRRISTELRSILSGAA